MKQCVGRCRRYLGGGIGVIGVLGLVVAPLAVLANLVVGLIALFHLFGPLALIGILLFPLVAGFYPFIVWIFAGDTGYLVLWGILWGVFISGGLLMSLGKAIHGREE